MSENQSDLSQIVESSVEPWEGLIKNQQKDIDDLRALLSNAKKTSQRLEIDLNRNDRMLKANQDLIFYGFIILLVMVAGMVVDVTRGKEAMYTTLMEKIDSMETAAAPQTYRVEIGGIE